MIRGEGANDSGGGYVSILVDRDTEEYPEPGERLVVETAEEHAKGYTERAMLVATLIRVGRYEACLTVAPDEPGWWIVYVWTPEGQLSWHVSSRDTALFNNIAPYRPVQSVRWDGHTTKEKYGRLARLRPNGPT